MGNQTHKMDAIKKKMQAMKAEKDIAMDRADTCEQQARDANLRAEKSEEEVRALQKKKKENHPKKTNNGYPFLRQPSLYFAIVLFRLFISILSLPFFCREFLFILDRSYVLASLK